MTGIREWTRWAAVCACMLAGSAHAATIAYEATQLNATAWRYDYSVTNEAGADPLQEFTIAFALDSFASLREAISPAGWDGLIGIVDPLLPADGYVDWCAFDGTACAGPGLAGGETLAGFSVVFDWLGAGAPGSQPFDVILSEPFALVSSGFTVPFQSATPVPEPETLALFSIALLALGVSRATRRPPASSA